MTYWSSCSTICRGVGILREELLAGARGAGVPGRGSTGRARCTRRRCRRRPVLRPADRRRDSSCDRTNRRRSSWGRRTFPSSRRPHRFAFHHPHEPPPVMSLPDGIQNPFIPKDGITSPQGGTGRDHKPCAVAFEDPARDGAIRTVTGLRLSEKRGTLRARSGNLVEASDRIPKGPGIKGGETRIRPAKPTTNPRRFHAQFILEHPENPSKAAREPAADLPEPYAGIPLRLPRLTTIPVALDLG